MNCLIRGYWKVKIALMALKGMFDIYLGTKIIYSGRVYTVLNCSRQGRYRINIKMNDGWVSSTECKMVISYRNLKHNYKFLYFFYTTYWVDVWCNNTKWWKK